jgi:hypothetical protein
MKCFICKEEIKDESISEVLPLEYKDDVVYCHTRNHGIKEEYEEQRLKVK